MKSFALVPLVALTLALPCLPALAGEHPSAAPPAASAPADPAPEPVAGVEADLLAVASADDSLKTFVSAVDAAGLADALRGEGPFTVFAPSDDAFAKLPVGTLDDLLKPENREKLAALLNYHVVTGKVAAEGAAKLKSAEGSELDMKSDGGAVTVDGAKVIRAGVSASNGVIHVLDAVLVPGAPAANPSPTGKPKDHPAH